MKDRGLFLCFIKNFVDTLLYCVAGAVIGSWIIGKEKIFTESTIIVVITLSVVSGIVEAYKRNKDILNGYDV